MNIFVLDVSPIIAAEYHCDKHVCKMILEYAQLLSTAHRILDGTETMVLETNKAGKQRLVKRWIIQDAIRSTLWQATHYNHPCAVWARETVANYDWLYRLLGALLEEYELRYNKVHSVKTEGLYSKLNQRPLNIPPKKDWGDDIDFNVCIPGGTPWPLCMPDQYKGPSAVESYRAFYLGEKMRFAQWKYSQVPEWVKITQL